MQVMAWCRQATRYYLNQCSPRILNNKINKNTTTTVKRYVNVLVCPRYTGHLIEKKKKHKKTPCDWSLFVHEVYSWVSRTAFVVSVQCNGGIRSYLLGPVIEKHLTSNAIMLFGVLGHIFNNNCVLFTIFVLHIPNELYLLAAGTQTITIK